MFREQAASGQIIDAHEVEVAAVRKGFQIAVEQDDGNTGLGQEFGNSAIDTLLAAGGIEWREEDADDLLFDELGAKLRSS